MNVTTIGFEHRRANKLHTCWGCGNAITPGEKYWRFTALVNGEKPVRIKTCNENCETIPDTIDQHQSAMAKAIYSPTLPDYLIANPDTFRTD